MVKNRLRILGIKMTNGNFSLQDLAIIKQVHFENPEARNRLEQVIASAEQDYVKLELDEDEFHGDDGVWTLAKNCPIEYHLCANRPSGCEGGACAFYNGHKERCVYPRTCINNTSSRVFLNLYDCFSGNIRRYWNVPKGERAKDKIEEKCEELGLDKYEDWAYAEFDDDGEKVILAELGTSEQAEQWQNERREAERRLRQQRPEEERKSVQTELEGLMSKYDDTTKEEIRKMIELSKRIR